MSRQTFHVVAGISEIETKKGRCPTIICRKKGRLPGKKNFAEERGKRLISGRSGGWARPVDKAQGTALRALNKIKPREGKEYPAYISAPIG